ncbi:MAG: mucoidy inhibitor MuiA family protein [Ruegeria sp.]
MRYLISLFALIPSLALADTFPVETQVSEVTLYPQSAAVTRRAQFEVPAGDHRLVLLGIPASDSILETLDIQLEGAAQNALVVRTDNVPWYDYKRDEVRAAEDRITEIERRIEAVETEAARARLKAEAAAQTIAFLGKLGDNKGLAEAGSDGLRDIARMIGEEALSAGEAAQTAEIEAGEIELRLEALQEELQAAQADLRAIALEDESRLFTAVDISAAEAVQGSVSIDYLVIGGGEWAPVYEFDLKTGETPEIAIARSAVLSQNTGENWEDVTLHLSTLQPTGENSASYLVPWRRMIFEPRARKLSTEGAVFSMAQPSAEADMVLEEAPRAVPVTSAVEGTGVTFTLPSPVSLASGAEFMEMRIDTLTQGAEVFALAVPLQDRTAFRTARFTNESGQTLLESSLSKWYVDGVFVAAGYAPMIRQGEEVEMGFGPLHGLAIKRDVLNRSSGDTGIITSSNQQVERVEILIENLTSQSWPLRLLDRVPYSEQDDLEIDWSASPRPDEENVDKQRGILAWEMELSPGQTETIRLDTTLGWPEGMELR